MSLRTLPVALECLCCDAAESGFERGWRAYLSAGVGIGILCPDCAERLGGEDEVGLDHEEEEVDW